MSGTGSPNTMVTTTRTQKRKCLGRKINRRTKRRDQERQQCHTRLRPQQMTDAVIPESLEVKVVHGKMPRMRVIQAKDAAYVSELVRLQAAVCSRC